MDDGTKLKPWGAPPITGTFAIAFEVELGKPGKQFTVSNIDDYNVAVNPNSDKTYSLVYQGNGPGAAATRPPETLVSFVPHNDAFKVSFEKVGLKPGTTNIVHGFLVIETSVGTLTQTDTKNFPPGTDVNKIDQDKEQQAFKKVAGHYMFSVVQSDLLPTSRQ
jgi:hypothetical protein